MFSVDEHTDFTMESSPDRNQARWRARVQDALEWVLVAVLLGMLAGILSLFPSCR